MLDPAPPVPAIKTEGEEPSKEDEVSDRQKKITTEKERVRLYLKNKGGKDASVNLSSMHNELTLKFKSLGYRRLIDFVLTIEGVQVKSLPQPLLSLSDDERAKKGAILINEKGTHYPPHHVSKPKMERKSKSEQDKIQQNSRAAWTRPFEGSKFALTCMAQWWEHVLGLPPTMPQPNMMFQPPQRRFQRRRGRGRGRFGFRGRGRGFRGRGRGRGRGRWRGRKGVKTNMSVSSVPAKVSGETKKEEVTAK